MNTTANKTFLNSHEAMTACLGRVVHSITGMNEGSEDVHIVFTDGSRFRMYHAQDCCESVSILTVDGDVEDLVGETLLMCEMVHHNGPIADHKVEYEPDSQTWTFCKFATVKGYVTVRWWGHSNGYYSETPCVTLEV